MTKMLGTVTEAARYRKFLPIFVLLASATSCAPNNAIEKFEIERKPPVSLTNCVRVENETEVKAAFSSITRSDNQVTRANKEDLIHPILYRCEDGRFVLRAVDKLTSDLEHWFVFLTPWIVAEEYEN